MDCDQGHAVLQRTGSKKSQNRTDSGTLNFDDTQSEDLSRRTKSLSRVATGTSRMVGEFNDKTINSRLCNDWCISGGDD